MIIGSVALAVVVGAMGLAAGLSNNDSVREARQRVMKVVKGTLTPTQFETLMDFRKAHRGEMEKRMEVKHPDPAELWRELDLTEDQQDRLLDVAASNVDDMAPVLEAARAEGALLKDAVLAGDPSNPELMALSDGLGDRIGDAAVAMAGLHQEIRAVLTPAQMAVLETRREKHDQFVVEALTEMPDRVEEVAGLWDNLALTPAQVDALDEIHGIMPGLMHRRHRAEMKEFRKDLAGVLGPDQLAVVDRVHDEHRAEAKDHRQARREARERLHAQLALTGEQKIAIVEIVKDNRNDLVPAVMLLAAAGMDLHDRVLAETTDETSIRLAADNLAETIGVTSTLAAQLVADLKTVLTPEQFAVIEQAVRDHDEQAKRRVAEIPARVHGLIGVLDELALSPEQKDAIVDRIEKKHHERRAEFMKMHGPF
jgi:Spy/CpxP family protein refolding chaperone